MGKRVVVIDDDPLIRSLVKDLLAVFGHSVEVFAHPAEGVAHVTHTLPEVVIVDFMMPELTGYQVIEQIRKSCGAKAPKVVLLTATLSSEHEGIDPAVRPDYFIEKPFDPQRFVEILEGV